MWRREPRRVQARKRECARSDGKLKEKKKEKHRKERKEFAQLKASDERGRKKAGAQKREEMRRWSEEAEVR